MMKDQKPVLGHGSIITFAVILIVSFVIGLSSIVPIPALKLHWPEELPTYANRYIPSQQINDGPELVLVYIGSSTCGFANSAELPELVQDVKEVLHRKAMENDIAFSAIGLSIDWDTDRGVQHLAKFGAFDEIITGRKWQGMGSRQFAKIIRSNQLVTPQVIVIMHTVRVPMDGGPIHIFDEKVLVRKAGFQHISAWLERGVPLPLNTS